MDFDDDFSDNDFCEDESEADDDYGEDSIGEEFDQGDPFEPEAGHFDIEDAVFWGGLGYMISEEEREERTRKKIGTSKKAGD